MKHWLLTAALACFGSIANAYTEVLPAQASTCTYTQVTVSSAVSNGKYTPLFTASLQGATTMFANVMYDRQLIDVYSVDASTNTLWCQIGLSSATVAGRPLASGDLPTTNAVQPPTLASQFGVPIWSKTQNSSSTRANWAAKTGDGLTIVPWCVNDSVNATIKAVVVQCRGIR